MSDRTLDIPAPADPVGAEPALTREQRLETRVRRLELENAQLVRERLQAELLGGDLTDHLGAADLEDLRHYLREAQRRPDLWCDGRLLPVRDVPPEAVLDLAELAYWRHVLARGVGLCTCLVLRDGRGYRPVDDGRILAAEGAACGGACVAAVAELLVTDPDPDPGARPSGAVCPECGSALWHVPVLLSYEKERAVLGRLVGHGPPAETDAQRRMVELVANFAGRRASEEYSRQAAAVLQLQVAGMIVRYTQEKARSAEAALTALERHAQVAHDLECAKADLERALVEAREARRGAELANRSKSMFLAAMSHEIRTPLTCVVGVADLLTMPNLGEVDVRDFAASIQESGQVLLSLINNVLDLSRIEAGRLDLERIPYSAREVLEEVCGIFASSSREKRVALELVVAPDVPAGQVGDPTRLRQIAMNLVGNALKFTSRGSVTVTCRRATVAGWLEAAVADTGSGIPADRLVGIFEPFQQAGRDITRKHGGSGLGLAIAHRTVAAMGGELTVESEVDRGSRFTFTFPESLPEYDGGPNSALDRGLCGG
ncbi:MAG: ATP-binding protein [Candidatus Latescibacteria bacterium]|nr:ATP-binding protein [Candidatus Latescibacterota bacterium]